jgi:hypothetical protein
MVQEFIEHEVIFPEWRREYVAYCGRGCDVSSPFYDLNSASIRRESAKFAELSTAQLVLQSNLNVTSLLGLPAFAESVVGFGPYLKTAADGEGRDSVS